MVSNSKIPLQSYCARIYFCSAKSLYSSAGCASKRCTKPAPKNENILPTHDKAQLNFIVCNFWFVACATCCPLQVIVCLNKKRHVGRCACLEPPPSPSLSASFRSGQQSSRPSRKPIQRADVSESGGQRLGH